MGAGNVRLDEDLPPGERKDCCECGFPMPAAARKCTKCESYQDWRGKFSFNATIISAITALIATTAALIPVIQNATARTDSKIYATYSSASVGPKTGSRISFILINAGDRPGIVRGGKIIVPGTPLPLWIEPVEGQGILVKPSEALIKDYRPGITTNLLLDRIDQAKLPQECLAEIELVSFRGQVTSTSANFPCMDISFLRTAPSLTDQGVSGRDAPSAPRAPVRYRQRE